MLHIYFLNLLFKIVLACSFRLSAALYHVVHMVWCNSKRELSSTMVGVVSPDDRLE